MNTPAFYESILSLPSEWSIEHIDVDHDLRSIHLHLAYLSKTGRDPVTGAECSIYDFRPVRQWRHLDTMQYKTYLHARLPRVLGSDGKPVTIEIPWSEASSRQTWFFEAWAIEVLLATKNQTQAAKLLRLSFYQMHRIMGRAVARGLQARHRALQTGALHVHSISLDEKCYKYRRFVSVISDPERGAILEVADGRTTAAAIQGLRSALPAYRLHEVTAASIDMSEAYHSAIRTVLPKAWIVYDKFHLFTYLTEAIDRTRRQEVEENPILKRTRFLWLKNSDRHTPKEQISFGQINDLTLRTSVAWRIRENFRALYECQSPAEATRYFLKWKDHVLSTGNKAMIKVAESFHRHVGGIINYFYAKASNAMAERLNGKIQELKVIGKGYNNFEQLRIAVLFFFGKLDLVPLKTQ